ncbi:MAG: ATP-binding cassette domain-containing protein [Treponema sp.]|nr:ATP-binding cassette domain-containing protein [Treponema sp.]
MDSITIKNLKVRYCRGKNEIEVLHGINISVPAGKVTAIIGGSGSGKSTLAKTLQGILTDNAEVAGQLIIGTAVYDVAEKAYKKTARKSLVSSVFQDAKLSLNPRQKIKQQLWESYRIYHKKSDKANFFLKAKTLMNEVGLRDTERILTSYPHELSGGMCQKLVIIMSLFKNGRLLIADEPTASLDEKSQEEVIKVFKNVNEKYGITILYITHDLNIIKDLADCIVVIKDGDIVETVEKGTCFTNEYSQKLLSANDKTWPKRKLKSELLLEINGLSKSFRGNRVLENISVSILKGEILGLYGPSGEGKTTFVRCVGGLHPFDDGYIKIGEHVIKKCMKINPLFLQMIFQDARATLNPCKTILELVKEPLDCLGSCDKEMRVKMAKEYLAYVSLTEHANKTATCISTGQCQRVAIARALISKPQLLICDEAVSAQDMLLQNQILDLLLKLQNRFGFSILLISHDQKMLFNYCDRVVKIENKTLKEICM